jgi:hypothetical protein
VIASCRVPDDSTGVGLVGRLADEAGRLAGRAGPDRDDGVGRQHDRPRVPGGDDGRLPCRQQGGHRRRGEGGVVVGLVDVGRVDVEREASRGQQLSPAGRCAGQNQSGSTGHGGLLHVG